jgi:hypothetical protein
MKDQIPPADHGDIEDNDAWAEMVARAQHDRTMNIRGRVYQRAPFGSDWLGQASPRRTCRDCGAACGEFHIPRCCWEQCPRCGGQAISCECENFS